MAEVDLDTGRVGLITRLNGSLKTYLALLLAAVSLGLSGGIWAFTVRQNTADITELQQTIKSVPPGTELARKDLVDSELKHLTVAIEDLKKEISALREDQKRDIAALREEQRLQQAQIIQLLRGR